MRGMYVNAFPATIDAIHRKPHYNSKFYDNLKEYEVDYDERINFLTNGRGT